MEKNLVYTLAVVVLVLAALAHNCGLRNDELRYKFKTDCLNAGGTYYSDYCFANPPRK